MKKIVYAVLATVSGLVLLLSYRTSHVDTVAQPPAVDTSATGSQGTTGTSGDTGTSTDSSDTGTSTDTGSSGTGAAGGTGTGSAGGTGSAAASGSSALADGTFTGSAVNTRFGPLQVRITVSGGRITDVQVPEYPSSNPRDRQINERALPLLASETTAAQSADIDMVSGATYTSQGYLSSLQSAIDQAHA